MIMVRVMVRVRVRVMVRVRVSVRVRVKRPGATLPSRLADAKRYWARVQ